ncbi:MAG: hypothetical protein Q8L92_12655, partial [Rubrivivax sp.]|nr:hypothetical protein [Rubrivivax sp.]
MPAPAGAAAAAVVPSPPRQRRVHCNGQDSDEKGLVGQPIAAQRACRSGCAIGASQRGRGA